MIKSLKVTITTAGTELPLSSTKVLAKKVWIKALAANTGLVGVGGSDVASSNWYELAGGASIELDAGDMRGNQTSLDLSTIYVDTATGGNIVSVLYIEA